MSDPSTTTDAVGFLLDANLLIALVVESHVHHDPAEEWAGSREDPLATCPITEGALLRLLVREGQDVNTAVDALEALTDSPRYRFWPDDVRYASVRVTGVVGYRQLTDAYLAQLARSRGARLATLDSGLAAIHQDVAELVPSGWANH